MQNHQHLTPAEALAEIQRRLKEDTDTVPEGWYTVRQLESIWGKANATTSKLAKAAVDQGLAEMRKFRVDTGAFVKPVPHYRFHARHLASKTPTPMAQGLPPRVA